LVRFLNPALSSEFGDIIVEKLSLLRELQEHELRNILSLIYLYETDSLLRCRDDGFPTGLIVAGERSRGFLCSFWDIFHKTLSSSILGNRP